MTCNTFRPDDHKSYWSGTWQQPNTSVAMVEVASRILEERPAVQPTGSDVYAWTLLTRPANGATQYWTQVGWHEHRYSGTGQTHTTFISWSVGYTWYENDYASAPIGSTPNYVTIYSPSTGHSYLWQDSTEVGDVLLGWTPTWAQVFGEIHTDNSQMPGGYNAHVTMRNTMYEQQGGNLVAFNASPIQTPSEPYFWSSKLNSTSYDIWDTACAS
jgi:hypothetical protein